ncbi:TetR family transcriptional regulator C-terminal domain-containing protein (plasmid) [Paenarthrobacter sp. OM7]|uniref:TetR/AcrR family transcriptional regulator n=1 Tax=Paenarthrobacter sp. OM7 TaxID=3041264 RepID=UPI002468CB2F|nr:TetR/AcrR family transcriptional regulator [Paenarthrobacter sp. OM7]WGM22916.1 TetR family transcriptional regulator C-terminal domain-containing protein [Paenarthrobacter sp. OM7]
MGSDTKEHILRTALELFHTEGFASTGITDITAAAGVPKGSFYHFFPSKSALALAVVEKYTSMTDVALLATSDASPLRRIHNHIDQVLSLTEAGECQRGCLLGNFSTEMRPIDNAVAEAVDAALHQWQISLADTITKARSAGELTAATSPELLASSIISLLEGAVARAKLSQSSDPVLEARQIIQQSLLT